MTVWTAIVVAAFLLPTGEIRAGTGTKGPYADEAACVAAIAEDRVAYPIGHTMPNGAKIVGIRFTCEERRAPGPRA